jgi:hypothetical protein
LSGSIGDLEAEVDEQGVDVVCEIPDFEGPVFVEFEFLGEYGMKESAFLDE